MLCFVWMLVFCCVAGGQGLDDWSNNTNLKNSSWGSYGGMDRTERFFSFFNVIRFKNNQCTGNNGQLGICYSRKECTNLGGIASGNCARNWGTCCVIQKTCGSTASLNCTYFVNSGFPAVYSGDGRCSIVVSKCNSDICQLRIDFLDFVLAQPDPEGNCVVDQFEIVGDAYEVPVICGENTGQHVYVDFVDDNTPIQLTVRVGTATGVNRKWNIRICQIGCASSERAPAGALMYYRGLTGTVKSFNYGTTVISPGTRQLVNMNYAVVVRPGIGYCSIVWSQDANDPYSFTVSDDTEGVPVAALGTADIALSGIDCTKDFIVIPNPLDPNMLYTDRFCGNALVPTTTFVRPFTLTVVTDDTENVDVMVGADIANRGFSLSYRQVPCN